MTENAKFKTGSVLSPLDSSLDNTTLRDADPTLWHLLRFFTGAINLHVGPRFNAIAPTLGLDHLVNKVVHQVIPYDPVPYLGTETQYKFPLIAAFRVSEDTSKWKSIVHYQIVSQIQFLYILPPLSVPDQLKQLSPLLTHVARTILDRTAHGFDQNLESGKLWWRDAGIQDINILSNSYGTIPKADSNIFFPTLSTLIQVSERHMFTDEPGTNFEEWTGTDGYIQISDGYQDPIDFIQVDIEQPSE